MPCFRDKNPIRTCNLTYTNYRNYKEYLRTDFSKRCGYCDDLDYYNGGMRGYHIDHFKPKSKFKDLENIYSNLIYSCPYCNLSKHDDWPAGKSTTNIKNNKGYIDPCDSSYSTQHFSRSKTGKIIPNTEVAKYMYRKLKLGLKRHQLIWLKEIVYIQLKELKMLIDATRNNTNPNPKTETLLEKHYELTCKHLELEDCLKETQ